MREKTALSGKLKFAAIILVVVGLAALLLPNQKNAPDGSAFLSPESLVGESAESVGVEIKANGAAIYHDVQFVSAEEAVARTSIKITLAVKDADGTIRSCVLTAKNGGGVEYPCLGISSVGTSIFSGKRGFTLYPEGTMGTKSFRFFLKE